MVLFLWAGCAAPSVPDTDARAARVDEGQDSRLARRSSSVAGWPASRKGTQIGGGLSAVYEPSGAWWHADLGKLFVVSDAGIVSHMNIDGSGLVSWTFAGDYEAITVADTTSDYAYVGVERPDSIVEVDLSTGTLTGRSWALEAWMASADPNLGLEALTFVPDSAHPYATGSSGGLFYAGLQATGDIYVFDVDLGTSGVVTHVDTFSTGRADLSDLYFHAESGVLYAIFDTSNVLREMTPAGATITEYQAPGTEQEGLTLVPGCPGTSSTIVIAEDAGPSVKTYARYPVECG